MRGEEYKIRKGEGGRRGIYEGGEEEYNIRKGEGGRRGIYEGRRGVYMSEEV